MASTKSNEASKGQTGSKISTSTPSSQDSNRVSGPEDECEDKDLPHRQPAVSPTSPKTRSSVSTAASDQRAHAGEDLLENLDRAHDLLGLALHPIPSTVQYDSSPIVSNEATHPAPHELICDRPIHSASTMGCNEGNPSPIARAAATGDAALLSMPAVAHLPMQRYLAEGSPERYALLARDSMEMQRGGRESWCSCCVCRHGTRSDDSVLS